MPHAITIDLTSMPALTAPSRTRTISLIFLVTLLSAPAFAGAPTEGRFQG